MPRPSLTPVPSGARAEAEDALAAPVAAGTPPPQAGADLPPDTDALMGISEMCEAFAVSPRTLRFYESKGLLAPQRVGSTRVYGRMDRARLSRILRAKSLGMPLAEIKSYLDMYGDHGEGRVQQLSYVIQATAEAIADLEAKRAQIEVSLAELRLVHDRSVQMLDAKRKGRGR